jgi:hypothetical protein
VVAPQVVVSATSSASAAPLAQGVSAVVTFPPHAAMARTETTAHAPQS